MGSENTVLSDFEHMQYADYAAQKISVYYGYLSILEKWFSEAGWELPLLAKAIITRRKIRRE